MAKYYQKVVAHATLHGCFKAAAKNTNNKILWHSTGADNPNARRYAGRSDTPAPIGANPNNNGFNQATDNQSRNAKGEAVPCPHGVMGLAADGLTMLLVETLPINYVCWCSGSGSKGYAGNANNNGYYQIEVCEDQSRGKDWAERCYAAMVEYSVEFFRERGIPASQISRENLTCHSEGSQDGIASNHGDPFHWLGKHGYSMEGLRTAVKSELSKSVTPEPEPTVNTYTIVKGDTMSGIASKHGVSLKVLAAANPQIKDLNKIYVGQTVTIPAGGSTSVSKKSVDEVARECIAGKWGNGEDRKKRLTAAGYDYNAVQKRVNEML